MFPGIGISPMFSRSGGASPFTTAFKAAVISNGGTLTATEEGYLKTFETSMGSDLLEFDRLWIHGLSNEIAAKTSFVNPLSTAATAINLPTFTPSEGFQGNGATNYIDTNYNPFTQGCDLLSKCIFDLLINTI